MNDHDLRKLKQEKLFFYLTVDGLAETGAGIFLVVISLVLLKMNFFIEDIKPATGFTEIAGSNAIPLIIPLFVSLVILKRKVTYPRIGIVRFRATMKGVILVVTCLIAVLLLSVILPPYIQPGIEGFILYAFLPLCLIVPGIQYRSFRFVLYGCMLMAGSALTVLLNTFLAQWMILFLSGVVVTVSGIVCLKRFLRTYPVLRNEKE